MRKSYLIILTLGLLITGISYWYLSEEKTASETVFISEKELLVNTSRITIDDSNEKEQIKDTSSTLINEKQAVITKSEDDEVIQSPGTHSFVMSLEEGDARTPPIVRSETFASPAQEVLEDEARYLEFYANEKKKVLASYVKAAGPKLEFLREMVAKGEKDNLEEAKLEEGRRKIQKIEEMLAELKETHPELVLENFH